MPDGKTYFVVAFLGRQGSSYLQGLLNDHPDAVCDGELFSPTASPFSFLRRETRPYIRSGLKGDPDAYLERFVHPRGARAAGFKLPYMSMQQHPSVLASLQKFDYRVIRITRANLLDQYISMKLAALNGSWRSDKGAYRIRSFTADPVDIAAHFDQWTSDNERLKSTVSGFPSIHITYEGLVEGRDIKASLEFLGLREAPLKSPYKRQRSGSQRQAIENLDAVRDRFAGTEWERHFEAA